MCASSLGNESMSTRLVHGGSTSLPPAVIMFVTLPSIYVVYKIGLYEQNVHGEYFHESQSIRKIREKFFLRKFSAVRFVLPICSLYTFNPLSWINSSRE